MKIFKKYAFTLLALITLAQTPQTNAVDWDWLKEFAVTAPLEHPYAFCTPCFPNAVTLAALYALKNYQNTISPLWAYVTVPIMGFMMPSLKSGNNTQTDSLHEYNSMRVMLACILSVWIPMSLAEVYYLPTIAGIVGYKT